MSIIPTVPYKDAFPFTDIAPVNKMAIDFHLDGVHEDPLDAYSRYIEAGLADAGIRADWDKLLYSMGQADLYLWQGKAHPRLLGAYTIGAQFYLATLANGHSLSRQLPDMFESIISLSDSTIDSVADAVVAVRDNRPVYGQLQRDALKTLFDDPGSDFMHAAMIGAGTVHFAIEYMAAVERDMAALGVL